MEKNATYRGDASHRAHEVPNSSAVSFPTILESMTAALTNTTNADGSNTAEGIPLEQLEALASVAAHEAGRMLARLQTGEHDGLPPHEHFTCGTGHIAAERTVRIIEQMAHWGPVDAEAIETINHLVDQAGLGFARVNLAYNCEVPF